MSTPAIASIRTRYLAGNYGSHSLKIVVRLEGDPKPILLSGVDGEGTIGRGVTREVRKAVKAYVARRDALAPMERLHHHWAEVQARRRELDAKSVEAARRIVEEGTMYKSAGCDLLDYERQDTALSAEQANIVAAVCLLGARSMPWAYGENPEPLYQAWRHTGVCPACSARAVTDGRCLECGWEPGS